MKFNYMHEDHDLLLCTQQYYALYADAIKKHYPNHKVETSDFIEQGNAYLFNEKKLKESYQKKMDENKNQAD